MKTNWMIRNSIFFLNFLVLVFLASVSVAQTPPASAEGGPQNSDPTLKQRTVTRTPYCYPPSQEVYAAAVAKTFIEALHQVLPNVKFDPTYSQMTDDREHEIQMRTMDGTRFEIRGSFFIDVMDNVDYEGNIQSCSLAFFDLYSGGMPPTIDEVINVSSGVNILPERVMSFDVSIDLDYPYGP